MICYNKIVKNQSQSFFVTDSVSDTVQPKDDQETEDGLSNRQITIRVYYGQM